MKYYCFEIDRTRQWNKHILKTIITLEAAGQTLTCSFLDNDCLGKHETGKEGDSANICLKRRCGLFPFLLNLSFAQVMTVAMIGFKNCLVYMYMLSIYSAARL